MSYSPFPYSGGGGGGGLVPLGRINSSAVASYDFTSLLSTDYDVYKLIGKLRAATDSVSLYSRFSDDNGATWKSASLDYHHILRYTDNLGSAGEIKSLTGQAQMSLGVVGNDTTAGEAAFIDLTLAGINDTNAVADLFGVVSYLDSSANLIIGRFAGCLKDETIDVDALQLFFSSGNIAAGDVTLYGVEPV